MSESSDQEILESLSLEEKMTIPYPFIQGEYGLNLRDIKIPFFGEIESGSGKKVYGEMKSGEDKASIEIKDETGEYNMSLSVRGDTMSGDLFTRKKTGESQPDFKAGSFVIWALKRFEEAGHPVEKIQARWADIRTSEWDSTNFTKYTELVSKGEDPISASRKTWSGKLFSELGYTEIEPPVNTGVAIEVMFKKPQLPPAQV